MLPVPIHLQRRSRLSAAADLAIVIVVFAAGSLSVPFADPILRREHGLSMAFAAAAFQFLLEGRPRSPSWHCGASLFSMASSGVISGRRS